MAKYLITSVTKIMTSNLDTSLRVGLSLQNNNISFRFSFGFLSAVFRQKEVVQFLLAKGANTKLGTNSKSYFGEGKTR